LCASLTYKLSFLWFNDAHSSGSMMLIAVLVWLQAAMLASALRCR
jgi:hypothetical protein